MSQNAGSGERGAGSEDAKAPRPEEHPNAQPYTVTVRYRGGSYHARILKTGCKASCTMSAEHAAQAVVDKFMACGPYRIQRISAEAWVLTDLRFVPETTDGGAK